MFHAGRRQKELGGCKSNRRQRFRVQDIANWLTFIVCKDRRSDERAHRHCGRDAGGNSFPWGRHEHLTDSSASMSGQFLCKGHAAE
jgi:hypothetical protein